MKKTRSVRPRAARTLLWNTHHDQPEVRRVAVIALLNAELAGLLDLGLQARQARWNVKGPQFGPLHALFGEVAAVLDRLADDLAERAVVLGGVAQGTVRRVARDTWLPAYPDAVLGGTEHIWALSAALARAAQRARAAITAAERHGDAGTTDLLTGLSRSLDRLLWRLEAHIALEPR